MPTATTDSTTDSTTDTTPITDAGADPRATPSDRATLLGSWRGRRRADLVSHLAYHGAPPLPRPGDRSWPEALAATVEASGLTGRGGASFPSATKIRLLASARGRSTLVVNVMEGEPASAKDKTLWQCVPHLVLDGAELAACAVGASRIVVCVADSDTDTAGAVVHAAAERAGTALAPVSVEVQRPPGRYVAGEESALVSWLGGGPGAPGWRPDKRRPLTIGRSTTLVHNAETLAHLALMARYGAASFRRAGLPAAPGTTLVTVTGGVERPGVYEVPLGTPLGAIVQGGRPTDEVAGVLTGGFGGSWVGAASLATPYAPGPLAAVGGVVGAGVLVVLTRRACPVAETARLARYMAGESAGQCGPCVFGLPTIADDLGRLARGDVDPGARARLDTRLDAVDGRGACRHPDGVARMVRSALSVFAADAAAHGARRPCAFVHEPSVLPPAVAAIGARTP